MKAAIVLFATIALAAQAQPTPSATSNFGAVNFRTSCATAVQKDFNHAVALLHSFEYDEARDAFTAIAKQDPNCAMAQWGIAMTYFHGLWGEIDLPQGGAAAAEAQRIAAANPQTTPREKAFIAAVAALYGDQMDWSTRTKTFSDKMEQVHAQSPHDDEAAIFYALSLDESAGNDPEHRNEHACVAILKPLFHEHPDHPGIAHYLIHCNDNDAMAHDGLAAAEAYAKIAPSSSHAEHMPSHIFARLGMWNQTIDSNIGAMQAAENDQAESECERRDNELHAMHFLQFAYLQAGRMQDAKQIADRAQALPPMQGHDCRASAAGVVASYALDARDWQMASAMKEVGEGPDRLLTAAAIALGSAHTGDLARAEEIERKLQEWISGRSLPGGHDLREVVRLEIASTIAEQRHDEAKARELMQSAVKAGPIAAWIMPPPEQLEGDLLLEQHHPEEALAAYRAALKATPNLFNAVAGAAKAAEMMGDAPTSARYYRQLLEVSGHGDRPELEQARKRLVAAK